MRKKWGNRIGAIVLACALTVNGLPVQSISTSTRKAYAAAKSETEKQDVSQPETKMGNVVLNGNDIAVNNVNGLTYKGFGMLSGNSTSDLLWIIRQSSQRHMRSLCSICLAVIIQS